MCGGWEAPKMEGQMESKVWDILPMAKRLLEERFWCRGLKGVAMPKRMRSVHNYDTSDK